MLTVVTSLLFSRPHRQLPCPGGRTNIALQAPAAGAVFDLNDPATTIAFGWDPDGGEYALVLSKSPYLLNPYVIEAGSTGQLTYNTADYQFWISNWLSLRLKPESRHSSLVGEARGEPCHCLLRKLPAGGVASRIETEAPEDRLAGPDMTQNRHTPANLHGMRRTSFRKRSPAS